jgi:putative DNA primase/helicase
MQIDIDKVMQASVGRWDSILAHLGINVGDGHHQPCPLCGGKDRFRYDNKGGRGTYFCNQCGAGDGFKMVAVAKNTDFVGAAKIVSEIVGGCQMDENEKKMPPDAKKMVKELWSSSNPTNGTPVEKYLKSRGLMFIPKVLKYCPDCYNTERGCPMPAMIAPVQNPDGKGVALHRTYLTHEGGKANVEKVKMLTPVTEPIKGGAIRLFPMKGDTLGVAEGIETAIACHQLFGFPVWAAVSSTIMEGFQPPKEARKIVIYADNDANFAGHKSAYILANRLYNQDRIVEVLVPDITGDFLDILNA